MADTMNGNGWLKGFLIGASVLAIGGAGASLGLLYRIDERVKVNERDRELRSNMVAEVAVLNERVKSTSEALSRLQDAVDPLSRQVERLNDNIEARRRDR